MAGVAEFIVLGHFIAVVGAANRPELGQCQVIHAVATLEEA